MFFYLSFIIFKITIKSLINFLTSAFYIPQSKLSDFHRIQFINFYMGFVLITQALIDRYCYFCNFLFLQLCYT